MMTLPDIRGRIAQAAGLAPISWFRVGGPAEFLVRPADAEDLCALMRQLPIIPRLRSDWLFFMPFLFHTPREKKRESVCLIPVFIVE